MSGDNSNGPVLDIKYIFLVLSIANACMAISLILSNVNLSKETGGKIDGAIILTAILYAVSCVFIILTRFKPETFGCKSQNLLNITNMVAYTLTLGTYISGIYTSNDALEKEKKSEEKSENTMSMLGIVSQAFLMAGYFLYVVFCILMLSIYPPGTPDMALLIAICIVDGIIFALLIAKRSVKAKELFLKLDIANSVLAIIVLLLLNVYIFRVQTEKTVPGKACQLYFPSDTNTGNKTYHAI